MRVLTLTMLLWAGASLGLPEEVLDLIEKRKGEFKTVIQKSTVEQSRLILERWTDLLLKSRFTLGMDVNRQELLDTLTARFGKDEASEAKLKKMKQLKVHSKTVEHRINQLVAAFHGRFRGSVLELNFKCGGRRYDLPFDVGELGNDLGLRMLGVSVPESREARRIERRCLDITLNEGAPSLLDWIGTLDAACPLPAERAGDCLLAVAEMLARTTGKESLVIEDASFIRCRVNRERANLRRLRIYQNKPSWYEAHQFVRMRGEDESAEQLDNFRAYLLSSLMNNLAALSSSDIFANAKRTLDPLVKEFLGLKKDETVANFMAWLWEKDCTQYTAVDPIITDPKRGTEFAKLYPAHALHEKRF